MTSKELEYKLTDFGNKAVHADPKYASLQAKTNMINQLLSSLELRTGALVDQIELEQADRVFYEYIKVLSGAVNQVGDLLTRPVPPSGPILSGKIE